MHESTHRMVTTLAALALLACGGQSSDGGEARAQPARQPDVTADTGAAPRSPDPATFAREHPGFRQYWYQGVAELSRYALRQARYGHVHEGEAVLIFVTEDFLRDRQVKYEHGDRSQAINVLKLNSYRRFYTGIYPYTLLTSTFTPVAGGFDRALKLSSSVQEWCGHAYTQLNRRGGQLRAVGHSYFQDEGDQQATLPDVPFEDALFTHIRRDPRSLPTGTIRLVPALHHLRFRHRPLAAESARASLEDVRWRGQALRRYRVEYPGSRRRVDIYFQAAFPHVIEGFEERDQSMGRTLTTTARRTNTILEPYWSHHDPDDAPYRRALGLEH